MTQYKDKVAKHKAKIEAEEWGRQVKYIHACNGIFEVAYNNGEKHFEETATGRKWKEGVKDSTENLIQKFTRFMVDVKVGRDPNGI